MDWERVARPPCWKAPKEQPTVKSGKMAKDSEGEAEKSSKKNTAKNENHLNGNSFWFFHTNLMKILCLYLTRSCQYLSNDVLFAWFLGGPQFSIVYSSGVIMMSHDNFMEIFVTEEKITHT